MREHFGKVESDETSSETGGSGVIVFVATNDQTEMLPLVQKATEEAIAEYYQNKTTAIGSANAAQGVESLVITLKPFLQAANSFREGSTSSLLTKVLQWPTVLQQKEEESDMEHRKGSNALNAMAYTQLNASRRRKMTALDIAVMEQLILSQAEATVLNRYSTYSQTVLELRAFRTSGKSLENMRVYWW